MMLKVVTVVLALWQFLPRPAEAFPSPQVETTSHLVTEHPITLNSLEETAEFQARAATASTPAGNILETIREGIAAMAGNLSSPLGGNLPNFLENLVGDGKGDPGKPHLIFKGSSALVIPMQDGMKNLRNFVKMLMGN